MLRNSSLKYNHPIKHCLQIFDSLLKPILCYRSEVCFPVFDEFKGRGRGREGDLPSDCPARLWGSKKAPWSDTGKDIRGGILIWFKAKYTNYIELVREGENDACYKKT